MLVLLEIVEFDDIGMVHFAKDFSFPQSYFLMGFHDFESECLMGFRIFDFENFAEVTTADGILYLIFVHL